MSDIRLDGLASGMDTEAIITKLLQLEQGPINSLKAQQQRLQTKAKAWRDVNSRLYAFQGKVAQLKGKDVFYGKKFEAGDTAVLSGAATSSATAGAYTIRVDNLAQYHAVNSRSFGSAVQSLGIGGTGTEVSIAGAKVTITATDSLTTLAAKINSASGIKAGAAVVQVGTNDYRLVVTSKTSGVAGAMSITDNATSQVLNATGLGLFTDDAGTVFNSNEEQKAKDASFMINGIAMTRSANSISDVLPGVSLTLKKSGTTSVTISDDTDKIVGAVKEFVNSYNELIDYIGDQKSYDSTTRISGALFGESGLLQIEADLRKAITTPVPGLPNSLNMLSQIGVSTGGPGVSVDAVKTGKLNIDETKLRDMLAKNPVGVAKLFGAVPVNLATPEGGVTVTASSATPGYDPESVINGDHSSDRWGTPGGGWNDGSPGTGDVEFDSAQPGKLADILTITFPSAKMVDTVNLWTLDSAAYPASQYGVRDFTVQYKDKDGNWKNAASVADNTSGYRSVSFDPVQTTAVRIAVTESNGANDYSRILEVQAMQYNQGVATNLYTRLYGYTRTAGQISNTTKSLDDEAEDMGDRIQAAEDRMAQREDTIRRQFTAMETALSKLKNQGSWLSSQLSALQ